MGHNLNLCALLGIPEEVDCPVCGHESAQMHDDYDIDSDCNPEQGVWWLSCHCTACEHEWKIKYVLYHEVDGLVDYEDCDCDFCEKERAKKKEEIDSEPEVLGAPQILVVKNTGVAHEMRLDKHGNYWTKCNVYLLDYTVRELEGGEQLTTCNKCFTYKS